MQTIYQVFIFLEGKKMMIGSILLLVLTFLLGRNLIATDTAALLSGIMAVLGLTAATVTGSPGYQAALGAAKKQ